MQLNAHISLPQHLLAANISLLLWLLAALTHQPLVPQAVSIDAVGCMVHSRRTDELHSKAAAQGGDRLALLRRPCCNEGRNAVCTAQAHSEAAQWRNAYCEAALHLAILLDYEAAERGQPLLHGLQRCCLHCTGTLRSCAVAAQH